MIRLRPFHTALLLASLAVLPAAAADTKRPDILFIAVDDLNDWIGCLGGHPQTQTPHFDRLASQSVMFTNAHCIAPSCGPVRSAILSGIPPWKSGLYHNMQPIRSLMPDVTLMPRHFANHGYHAAGAGKILHYIIDPPSWDDYFPDRTKDNPLPFTLYPENRPVSLPRAGPWQYVETDWTALDATDEEFGGDHSVTEWVSKQLATPPEDPFFLACGIYRPHEPWFVPAKYFEPFPLDEIQLPPGYRAGDLDDVPPSGRRLARNQYFPHIQWHGEWRHAVQSYLASIHFADAMLGRVLDALEKSPRRDHTIVVLWSDHGWHLGEKEHWQKYTAWRACTRVPFMIFAPPGCPGLPAGTTPARCYKPVSTFDTFRTLVSLTGIPARNNLHGNDLTPLLENPDSEWPHYAITQLGKPGDFAVSGERFRYIHYQNGDEELYDISKDPHEFTNLAADPAHSATLERFRPLGPKDPVPLKSIASGNPQLHRAPAIALTRDGDPPASKASTRRAPILIRNVSGQSIQLFWIDTEGNPQAFGEVAKAAERVIQSFAGHTWLVKSADGRSLGHFVTPARGARVTVSPTPSALGGELTPVPLIEKKVAPVPQAPAIDRPLPRPLLKITLQERGEFISDPTVTSIRVFDPAAREKGLRVIFTGPGQNQHLRFLTPLHGGYGLASGRLNRNKEPQGSHPWFWFNLLDGTIGPQIDVDLWEQWKHDGWFVGQQQRDPDNDESPKRVSSYHPFKGVVKTMDLDFSHLYWHEKPELLGVTKLNGMDTIVRIDVSASAYEIVGSLPPGFRKSDAFFRSEIRSAGRNCRDGIYHIQGFSLSYQPEGGSWHSVIRDVHIVKTFGGASPYLPVRYLGNGRFAVAKTTRDDVDISEIPAQEETLLGAAEAVTLLVDGLSGKILKQSEPYIYNHNPPLKIPDTWWADGFQLPAPDDAEPPRKSLFHWNETTRELRFTGDKLITLTEDDELLESDDGQFMLIYQKCPRGDGKTRTKVPFRILDGRTGGSYSTEVESDFYEVWTEASWETLCPP